MNEAAKELAKMVMEAANSVKSEANTFGDNKIFISAVYEAMKEEIEVSIEEFKKTLIELNRLGALRLSRSDMSYALDRALVEASETKHMASTFHFINL